MKEASTIFCILFGVGCVVVGPVVAMGLGMPDSPLMRVAEVLPPMLAIALHDLLAIQVHKGLGSWSSKALDVGFSKALRLHGLVSPRACAG